MAPELSKAPQLSGVGAGVGYHYYGNSSTRRGYIDMFTRKIKKGLGPWEDTSETILRCLHVSRGAGKIQ
ncbi:poly(A) polymerase [Aspergillus luchuensis]|uniref:Poly(A) polymerase n=1 Tax=Aspergillus kawachii TaxID=1069201 RepID=A0A146EZW9_ASPKA|nr:poly(A) polymerase [Aspergillus luchuensis]